MRRRLVTILLAIVSVGCFLGTSYGDDGIIKLAGDKNYWSSFNWDNPERSKLSSVVPWSGLGMRKYNLFKYAYQSSISDVPVLFYFMRSSLENNDAGDLEITYTAFDKQENASNSNKLLNWCVSNYGNKYVAIKNIKRKYTTQDFNVSYAYWENGNTLIRLTTSDIVDNGMQIYMSRISYLDARYNKIRSPEISLSCELDTKKHGNEISDFFPDKMQYKIDESEKIVKDFEDNVISENLESSDTLFKFSKQTETMLRVNAINRITGDFVYKLYFSSNKSRLSPNLVITGKCSRVESSEKKF